ncbi:hypothetical protein GGS21DRAFT_492259 [Xylaria nigripes]|nr:hypothetical protein GGS21DRAFT_492259 [Xylaria nigripes]
MKACYILQAIMAATSIAQNFNSGTQTITVSGNTITVGGTNVATITVGSNTFTVGSTTSSADDGDASATADAVDDGDSDAAATAADDDGDDTDGATVSGYTNTPTTLTYGSSKIVLGPSAGAQADSVTPGASSGFSYSANGTFGGIQPTGGNSGSSDNGGDVTPSATATAVPSGPTTSLDAAPTDAPSSGAAGLESAGGLLALMGAGLLYIL